MTEARLMCCIDQCVYLGIHMWEHLCTICAYILPDIWASKVLQSHAGTWQISDIIYTCIVSCLLFDMVTFNFSNSSIIISISCRVNDHINYIIHNISISISNSITVTATETARLSPPSPGIFMGCSEPHLRPLVSSLRIFSFAPSIIHPSIFWPKRTCHAEGSLLSHPELL